MNKTEYDTIIFKSYFLTRALCLLFGGGMIISALIFFFLKIDEGLKLQVSTTTMGLGSIIVLYLNRFEPHYIKFNNETIILDYINKFLFKSGRNEFAKKKIRVKDENGIIMLFYEQKLVAKIREGALIPVDWDKLRQYFKN